MDNKSIFILAVSVLGAIGAWMLTLQGWAGASEPVAIGGLLVGIASVLGGAFGVSRNGAK